MEHVLRCVTKSGMLRKKHDCTYKRSPSPMNISPAPAAQSSLL